MDNKNNNDPNRLITVAIHTFDRAVELKNTLDAFFLEGVLEFHCAVKRVDGDGDEPVRVVIVVLVAVHIGAAL